LIELSDGFSHPDDGLEGASRREIRKLDAISQDGMRIRSIENENGIVLHDDLNCCLGMRFLPITAATLNP
jgi:hypothetical protein